MLVSHEISRNWLLMHTACHLRHLWYREKLKSNHLTTIGGVVESHEEDESMNHLLSINAIQDALDVSRSTVYRLIKSGELDVIYVLSAPRIPLSSLESEKNPDELKKIQEWVISPLLDDLKLSDELDKDHFQRFCRARMEPMIGRLVGSLCS